MRGQVILAFLAAVSAEAATLEGVTHFSSEKVRGAFLVRGVGARMIGMGEAFTAVADDASALTVNPGGAGQVRSIEAVAMYGMLGNDQGLTYAAAAVPFEFGVVSMSLIALNYGEYESRDDRGESMGSETAMDVGLVAGFAFANPKWLGDRGSSGIAFEFVKEEAAGMLWGVSVGGIYPAGLDLKVGWALQHLGPAKDGFSLPALVKIGGAYAVGDGINLAVDVGYPLVDRQVWIAAGIEYAPLSMIVLRTGYKFETASQEIDGVTGLTAGAGFRIGAFGLDYAYQPFGDLATTHRMSLVYRGRGKRPARWDPAREPVAAAATATPLARSGMASPDGKPASAEDAYSQAVALYQVKDYDGAWRQAYMVLKRDPKHWQAWSLVGNCQYARGDIAGAVSSYERSLSINPANTTLKSWLGKLKGAGP